MSSIVVRCLISDFDSLLDMLQRCNFTLSSIQPADSPSSAVLVGFGVSIRLTSSSYFSLPPLSSSSSSSSSSPSLPPLTLSLTVSQLPLIDANTVNNNITVTLHQRQYDDEAQQAVYAMTVTHVQTQSTIHFYIDEAQCKRAPYFYDRIKRRQKETGENQIKLIVSSSSSSSSSATPTSTTTTTTNSTNTHNHIHTHNQNQNVVSHSVRRGRAGMMYKDLVPSRLFGLLIASHIFIPESGPVPDYVHYHDVLAQIIFVHTGWVEVVYEDQGEPFIMRPGDCVIQPPGIRHRVLRSGDSLSVVEVTLPSDHVTYKEAHLQLPNVKTSNTNTDVRKWKGQKFHFYRKPVTSTATTTTATTAAANSSTSTRTRSANALIRRSLGMDIASNNIIHVSVIEHDNKEHQREEQSSSSSSSSSSASSVSEIHNAIFVFWFVLSGRVTLTTTVINNSDSGASSNSSSVVHILDSGLSSSVVLPRDTSFRLSEASLDLQILEVALMTTEEDNESETRTREKFTIQQIA